MTTTNGSDKKIPLHLADVTIKAVDQIGEHAAKEIEKAAEDIRKGAEVVTHDLEDLAHAVREHTIKASELVAVFVQTTTHTLGVIKELQERINGGKDGSELRSSGSDSGDTTQVRREAEGQKVSTRVVPPRPGQSKSDADPVPSSSAPGTH